MRGHLFLITILPVTLGAWIPSALRAEDVEARCKAIATRVSLPKPVLGSGCDAYSLYYGSPGRAGNKADPKAAFACASKDLSKDQEMGPLDGPAMMATVYANGVGAPRDLDRAAAYVCRMNVAEAEKEGMLDALSKIRAGAPSSAFRVCDYATSTMLATACFEREDSDKQHVEEDYFQDLQATLRGPAISSFAKLRAAEGAFAGAISGNEVDASGTGGPVFTLRAERQQKDAFLDLVRSVMSGALPPARPLANADKDLNAVYSKIMKGKDKTVLGTVDKDGVRTTQKAWLTYRDRFVAFAAAAAPAVPADTLKAVLTEQRVKQLQDLGGL